MRENEKTIVSGKLEGFGNVDGNLVSLSYTIIDNKHKQQWNGAMIIYLTGRGNLTGYYITSSQTAKGKTTLGSIELKRL